MKAIQVSAPNIIDITEQKIPHFNEDEVLIKVMASGICGTDLHICRGDYMGTYPIIPGHEFSGEVKEIGNAVTRFKVGDRVAVEPNISCDNCQNCLRNRQNFCLNWQAIGVTRSGGMAQYVVAPEKALFSIEYLDFEEGAFMEPLSCVIHGIENADVSLADKVLLMGAGPIGLLLLQVVRHRGCSDITVVDKNKFRLNKAKEFNADQTYSDVENLASSSFDLVIDATGNIPLMERAGDLTRSGGRILFFGVPPKDEYMNLNAHQIFQKGLKIIASFTSNRNSVQAVELLYSGRINVKDIISHRLGLDEFKKGIEILNGDESMALKIMIIP